MKNLSGLLEQAKAMQEKMAAAQDTIARLEVEGQSGAGLVKITMTGKGTVTRVAIDPSLVVASEKEMLEDLIAAALNDARAKADARAAEEMSKVAGGLNLPPGLKLPF